MSGTSASAKRSSRRVRQDYKRLRLPKSEFNLDWARVNVELTPRREKILELLKTHRILTAEQLEYLHPDYGHQSQSQMLLRRDISKLHEVYLVDKAAQKKILRWDGTEKKTMVAAIGRIGSQYVGWAEHYERIRYENGSAILPKTAHHVLRVHDMEILARETLKSLRVDVLAWVFECGKQIIQHPTNGLNPDAFCIMGDQVTGEKYTAFFEYDTGSMDLRKRMKFPELEAKFDKYKGIQEWRTWYQRPLSLKSENKFPYVFFVTEEEKRFPVLPELLSKRGIKSTVCMQSDFVNELKKFIHTMRKSNV
ncbi:replication-relaxation family protein [Shimazuella kribbensis]|uniref:replication-relaxation family protein n=1 Tax=Shimazuella kribbensis TaxID=139808 RepID=UPI000686AD85|nr:replication-relaxation family protein [Shimazuella kribbensis]